MATEDLKSPSSGVLDTDVRFERMERGETDDNMEMKIIDILGAEFFCDKEDREREEARRHYGFVCVLCYLMTVWLGHVHKEVRKLWNEIESRNNQQISWEGGKE